MLLAVGAYMKLNNLISTGQPYTMRFGRYMKAETIDGNGALFFGIMVLIVSLIAHRVYVYQKIDRMKRKEEENNINCR